MDEKVGEIAGALKTFMELYARDRKEDRIERAQCRQADKEDRELFRSELKEEIQGVRADVSCLEGRFDFSEKSKAVESSHRRSSDPRSRRSQAIRFVIDAGAATAVLTFVAAVCNWAKHKLALLIGH